MFMRRQPYDIDHQDYAIVDKLFFSFLFAKETKIYNHKKVQGISICFSSFLFTLFDFFFVEEFIINIY